jgi:hypothetical protein
VAIEAVLRAALDHGSSTLTPPPAQTQQPE